MGTKKADARTLRTIWGNAKSEFRSSPISSMGVLLSMILVIGAIALAIVKVVVNSWLCFAMIAYAVWIISHNEKMRHSEGTLRQMPFGLINAAAAALLAGLMPSLLDGALQWIMLAAFGSVSIWFTVILVKDWTMFCSWLLYNIENKGERSADANLYGEKGMPQRADEQDTE